MGALKVEVIRVTPSYKRHSFRQRGGALGAHMNLFGRIARVLKVASYNMNALFLRASCAFIYPSFTDGSHMQMQS